MKKFKHTLAALLAGCMLAGLMPAAAFAETGTPETAEANTRQVVAEELDGVSRLESSTEQEPAPSAYSKYADDELVTAIVELEEAPVLEYFGISTYAETAGDTTPGAAVSAFLTSDDAQELSDELATQQDAVLAQISQAVSGGARSAGTVEVVGQWTQLINAVAVKVPYGRLADIRALPGVKRAYVERVFDRPDETVTEAGAIAGYSYDMVGIQEVWDAGYTGKGMLVAVLDTGLDLDWRSYASPHIVSCHEAFTEDSFKSADAVDFLRYTNESLAAFLKENSLNAEFRGGPTELEYEDNALYKNLKVPFAFDYADLDLNVQPASSEHGTHVAGTVAGYAATDEGEVKFSGVAPDAQLLILKVFPDTDGGAQETDTIAALEDAMILGADVINLSLGSDNGFAEDDTAQQELYQRVRTAGILLMTSAGNSAYSSANNNYGGYNLADDPEVSMMSAPAIYSSNLAVASINNTVQVQPVFTWTDAEGVEHRVQYSDPNGSSMKYKFVGQSVPIVPVDGVGTYNDYYNAGFRSYYGYGEKGVSGIALVQRGEISFADKINNASQFVWQYYDSALGQYVSTEPVRAVLVYDNVTGDLISMDTSGTILTSAFISKADGEEIIAAIEAGYEVCIEVQETDDLSTWESGGQMSEFSSWGAGPALELKPEITAPGGNIWSSIPDWTKLSGAATADYTGTYAMMSGTSMAAPHMTGITALVEQYVRTQGLDDKKAEADLTSLLMVSTAVPQVDPDGVYYSPRLQGAGLVNAAAAISTPAYITVDGQSVGKLELKDDPQKTGAYALDFHVNNLTGEQVVYTAKAVLLCPTTEQAPTAWGDRTLMTDSDGLLGEFDLGTVTVPANGTATVEKTVTLDADQRAKLDAFANGTYVEGFIILTAAEEGIPQIGLPMLAFYGDWTAAPIFDRSSWLGPIGDSATNYLENENAWGITILGYYDGYSFYNLGQNPFDQQAGYAQAEYKDGNITLAPGTGLFQTINDYELYQLRESRLMVVEVHDAKTNELYYRDYAGYQFKTYYNSSYGVGIPSSLYYFTSTDWSGTDLNGNVLPSGTECIYTITAYGDGEYPTYYDEEVEREVMDYTAIIPGENEPTFNGHAMDLTGNVISFRVMVDTVAPSLVNNAVSFHEEDGKITMTGSFVDDGSIASVEVYPQVKRTYKEGYGNPDYAEYGIDTSNPFYVNQVYDEDVTTLDFSCDVTSYEHTNEAYAGENNYFNYEWTGNVYIFGGDYGGNDRGYAVTVNATPGLLLSTTSALLKVGDEFDLSVNNNTDSDAAITRESSNPEVATVDDMGHIVALAPGQTTITYSNGEQTVVCIVAVEERHTEVLDFDLALDSFSGLKPNGGIVVKVVNLQPADVELNEIRWEVYEDDPDLYTGLINCAQYTTDGLSGEVYLNYNAYGDNPPIVGASGTLQVTLNGVTRELHLDWEDLYKNSNDEDLVSDLFGGEQTVYVTQGETATLTAKYNDTNSHSFSNVALYTAQDYVYGGSANPIEEATGLVLDGPAYCTPGSNWVGKLVNLEGYALPESIHVVYHYDYGYEYELTRDAYYNGYTYNSETGEISAPAPYGSSTTLVIRADGVESEGNPAGELSGIEYPQPEELYGPFDWAATEGHELTGVLATEEGVLVDGYTVKNVAYYTPAEPGVSYLTATTKDGQYSLNFAVVSLPVVADTLELDLHNLELEEGEVAALTATLTPEPSLEEHKQLIWTSFNPDVATVDENGVVTAVSEGYAYLSAVAKVASSSGSTVRSYCVVHVTAKPIVTYTVTFEDHDGTVLETQAVAEGNKPVAPVPGTHGGYVLQYWVDENGAQVDPAETVITGDRTFRAVCAITYSFVVNGEVVGTVTKLYGETLTEAEYPALPAQDGYTAEWQRVEDPKTGEVYFTAVYTKILDPTPTAPGNTDNTDTDTPSAEQPAQDTTTTVSIPATGDASNPILWVIVLVVSAAVLVALVVVRKRRNR